MTADTHIKPTDFDQKNPGYPDLVDGVPIVKEREGDVFADSRDVAVFFHKRHDHVMRDIRSLVAKEPSLGISNFGAFKINDLTGESTSHYEMDRIGFTLLAMGFTGVKALKWKLRYIEAFDTMESSLRARQAKFDPSDPSVILAFMNQLQKQVADRDAAIVVKDQRLKTLDRLEGADGSMCITDAAKTLGFDRVRDFFVILSARRWIFKRKGNSTWLAFQDKIQGGYMEHDDHPYLDQQGRERVATRALVTAKGLVRLAQILEELPH